MATAAKPRVLVTRLVAPGGLERLAESGAVDVELFNPESDAEAIPRHTLLERVRGCAGLYCALTDKIDAEVLDAAGPTLKVISTISVGFDHIDVAECKKRGIAIGNTPGVLTDATADIAVGLMLSVARHFPAASEAVKNGGWGTWRPGWMCGADFAECTVGIVGAGRIGQAVARRMTGFGSRIVYSGRSAKPEMQGLGEHVSFEKLLETSDFITVHCALTPETRGLFSQPVFAKMKKNAILVNTSRGPVVNQDDLYDALVNGTIAGAGLDVTVPEPLPTSHKLLTLPNCLILPHIGSATHRTRSRMAVMAADNLLAGIRGEPLPNPV